MAAHRSANEIDAAWRSDPRWSGIQRPYSGEDVVRLRGTIAIEHSLARRGAQTLWNAVTQKTPVRALGALTGNQAVQYLSAYAMTKAGIQMLAKNLVIELSPYGITINAIAPGATLTERTLTTDPDYEETWRELTPLGKPARTSDIAHAALFLVSPGSNHITGQTLVVDGGWASVSPSPGEKHFHEVESEKTNP